MQHKLAWKSDENLMSIFNMSVIEGLAFMQVPIIFIDVKIDKSYPLAGVVIPSECAG